MVRFFGSRLKWSRWAAVDLVDGEDAETLVRTVAEHFVRFGGVALCAVLDRPQDGSAYAALELRDRWKPGPLGEGLVSSSSGGSSPGATWSSNPASGCTRRTTRLPNRATGEVSEQRRQELERLALRIPIQVDVTGEMSRDGPRYSMPPQARPG